MTRLHSTYYVSCLCGEEIQTTRETGVCLKCGRLYRIEFSAKHDPPTKEETITEKYEKE